MVKVKVGLVGLMQPNFRGDKESVYRRCVEGLKELSEELGFELFSYSKLLSDVNEAKKAKEEIENQAVDFLLILNVSFASGYLVQTLAQTDAFIGLWSVPEQSDSGPLPQNSFCAMNLNASLMKLAAPHKKFKWFYGYAEEKLFRERFSTTIRALSALKNLKDKRIVQIGGHAPGFDSLAYDAERIREIFGVHIKEVPFETLKDLMQKQKDVEDIVADLKRRHKSIDSLSERTLGPAASLIRTLREICETEKCGAIALLCWPRFRSELSMVPCASMGYLNDEGFVVACEGDVLGALSMLVLKLISNHPAMLFDVVSLDLKDESLLFWHCGVGMKSYSNRLFMKKHFNPGPYDPEKGWLEVAPVSEMVVDPMPATVLRLTENGTKAFVFEGEFLGDVKPSFDGSRGWFSNMKDHTGRKLQVLDLVNTLMCHRLEHHFAVVRGHWAKHLVEMFRWLGVELLETVPYSENSVC